MNSVIMRDTIKLTNLVKINYNMLLGSKFKIK